jgi:hypothetical protein
MRIVRLLQRATSAGWLGDLVRAKRNFNPQKAMVQYTISYQLHHELTLTKSTTEFFARLARGAWLFTR